MKRLDSSCDTHLRPVEPVTNTGDADPQQQSLRAERMARISLLPDNDALRAWADLRAPDQSDFNGTLHDCIVSGCPELVAEIQAEHPTFTSPAYTVDPVTIGAIAAHGIKCEHLMITFKNAADVAQAAQHFQNPNWAVANVEITNCPDIPLADWQGLIQSLPAAVKRVYLAAFKTDERDLALALPNTVEALKINGAVTWNAADRQELLQRNGLKELALYGPSVFGDWASALEEAGRKSAVEKFELDRCWSAPPDDELTFRAINSLVAADTNLMHLGFVGHPNRVPSRLEGELAENAAKNHTLQTLEGIELPAGVPAYLDRNRRALNMAMREGSAALFEDRHRVYQHGGEVLGVVISHLGNRSSDSHDFTNVVKTNSVARAAARAAGNEIMKKSERK